MSELGEVFAEHLVPRVIGRALRHRELSELGGGFARNEVSRFVHSAARIIDVPEATGLTRSLKPVEVDSAFAQVSGTGKPGWSRADDGVLQHPSHFSRYPA